MLCARGQTTPSRSLWVSWLSIEGGCVALSA